MRFYGFPRVALRLAPRRVAPLAALLLSAALLLGPSGAAAQDERNFTLQNSSGSNLVVLQLSPTNVTNWGPNILRSPVGPGQSTRVTFGGGGGFVPCQYDIRVTMQDGQVGTSTQDLCTLDVVMFPAQFYRVGSAPAAPAQTFQQPGQTFQQSPQIQLTGGFFTLQNRNNNVAIATLRLRPSGTTQGWSEDLLDDVVMPGQSARVDFRVFNGGGQCTYDMEILDSNNQINERRNVNVCGTDFVSFP